MSRVLAIVVPYASAAVLPVVALCLYVLTLGVPVRELGGPSLFALVISCAHVTLLGVPAVLLLLRTDWLRWWSATTAGFIAGGLPIAILTWTHAGGSENGMVLLIGGVPILEGWQRYYGGVFLFFGALGALGGATFWFVRRHLMRSNNRWRGP